MENIQERNIENELTTSYLTYAMSVNTNRAIPDVRDGLKPSTRRIIYAMGQINLTANRPYDKCAAVVGEVMKNYHPHGDGPIYGTLVGLAQPFSIRYPLIDGQGNFGSIDDDPPGAMRYTECRLAVIASEMLTDIEKQVVDFQPNYKDSLEEPTVLPGLLPNLLVNGTTGIGVGYLTRIPPHNLTEVVDALLHKLTDPDATSEVLMEHILGPDFPTAGIIVGTNGIQQMYTTGKGSITIRAKTVIERISGRGGDREQIVITEIPYQVKKNQLLQRMYDLVVSKTITGIADIRDESDQEIRIVILLKRGEIAQVILNQLYKHTQMQTNFSANLLCLVEGLPKVLTLEEILRHYLEHRRDVVRRRTQFELTRAERRNHILEGYLLALQNLEAIIELVQTADSPQAAEAELRETYQLSQQQAREILTMTLRQLTGLERQRIHDEYTDLLDHIAEFRAILADETLVTDIIRTELETLKEKYGDERRTELTGEVKEFEVEDLIADEEMVVTLSHAGYIKRLPMDTYRKQHRGGVGIRGATRKDGDFLEHIFVATAHQNILFFTDLGKCYTLKVHQIPESSRQSAGRAVVNLLRLSKGENITAYVTVPQKTLSQKSEEADAGEVAVDEVGADAFVFMATQRGIVKKTELSSFENTLSSGIIAVNLDDGDKLIGAQVTDGNADVILITHKGVAIRFSEKDARPLGRNTRGVRGIELGDADFVAQMVIVQREASEMEEKPAASKKDDTLLIVTENGYGKRTAVSAYRSQKRGGKGVIAIGKSTRNGAVVAAKRVANADELVLISSNGYVTRTAVSAIRRIGRNTQGVRIMALQADEKLVDAAKIELSSSLLE
ncbi:DNA gyrase subunit A [Candidatus Poribacteria bacterium]|nr:DNA gyrase subunit A [Candidatus Poribacteria bacterium]MYA56060.1 DNA gyrase subunit A [Candidatus Poribacteria bacterium]